MTTRMDPSDTRHHEPLASADPRALETCALALQRAAQSGNPQALLRGRFLGLVCERNDCEDAERFHRAATTLGATVARIRPSAAGLLKAEDAPKTALWLGRLYDAIACYGVPAAIVQQLRDVANVPVFEAIGSGNEADQQPFMLQALLVSLLGRT